MKPSGDVIKTDKTASTAKPCTYMLAVALISGLVTSSSEAASSILSTVLAAGETSQDGMITLEVHTFANGDRNVALRNNYYRAVIIDSYNLSGASSHGCSGKSLRIPTASHLQICLVPKAMSRGNVPIAPLENAQQSPPPGPELANGSASLQVALSWHETPRKKLAPTPTPSPTLSPPPAR